MCTVSWLFTADGYELFFNRDELKSRQRAQHPSIKAFKQTQVISPRDPDAGGTWICSNEHGLTLCLLNNYAAQASVAERDWVSRGLLVQDLSHLANTDSLLAQFNTIKIENYRPFDLLALSPEGHVCQLSWDGFEFRIITNPVVPLTSSSFATEDVIKTRRQHFHDTLDYRNLKPQQLHKYHASHTPEAGALSVCMHRDNGQTVSFCHIKVGSRQICFDYYDGSPCNKQQAHRTELELLSTARTHVA